MLNTVIGNKRTEALIINDFKDENVEPKIQRNPGASSGYSSEVGHRVIQHTEIAESIKKTGYSVQVKDPQKRLRREKSGLDSLQLNSLQEPRRLPVGCRLFKSVRDGNELRFTPGAAKK